MNRQHPGLRSGRGRRARAAAALPLLVPAGCSGGPAADDPPTDDGPVALGAGRVADAPAACTELLARLPVAVADQGRRDVTPTDVAGAAWGAPPITLVCGVDEPAGFTDVASCVTVNGVDWFIPTEQLEAQGDLTMTVVYREVGVEVQLPAAYFPPAATLADLAPAVRRSIPKTDECF